MDYLLTNQNEYIVFSNEYDDSFAIVEKHNKELFYKVAGQLYKGVRIWNDTAVFWSKEMIDRFYLREDDAIEFVLKHAEENKINASLALKTIFKIRNNQDEPQNRKIVDDYLEACKK